MSESDLSSFRWTHRPLVVFGSSPDAAAVVEQRWLLAGNEAGLREREIQLVEVFEPDHPLRDRFSVTGEDFLTILVGKDGTEQARWTEPVEMETVFGLIDRMPMRQRESGASPEVGNG